MAIFNYVVMAVALATASHAALPKVTPVLAGSDCSVYPGYDASMETAGPFIIQTNSCTNSSIEGFGDSQDLFYQEGVEGIYRGYITIVYFNQLAKTAIRCINTDSTASVLEAYVPYGVSGVAWQQINITSIPYSAELMWGLPEAATIPIEPYYHYYANGTQQPGLFLGSHNVTTWGIKYYEADSGSYGDPYWLIRLLGPGSEDPITGQPLDDGEYETFIRVEGS